MAVPFHTTPPGLSFFQRVWERVPRFQAQVAVAGAVGVPLPRLRAEPAVVAVPLKPPPPDPPEPPPAASEGSSAMSSSEQPEKRGV